MEQLTIGKGFALACPEGFRPLTGEEKDRLHMPESDDSLGLIWEEGRTVVSVGWKEVNALAGVLLRIISPVTSTEASVNQAMAGYGYKRETRLSRSIGGEQAEGFRYTYAAGDSPMVGETYVVRHGRSLTFFHAYLPAELREQGLMRWNELLDNVQSL